MTFDRDRSGTVEPHELHQAIASFGYNLSPQALAIIVQRYSTNGRIGFDDFVALSVKLRAITGRSNATCSGIDIEYLPRLD